MQSRYISYYLDQQNVLLILNVKKILQEGQYFGDFEILRDISRKETIISEKNTQLLIITKDEFKNLIDNFN